MGNVSNPADEADGESHTVAEFCELEKIGKTKFYQEANSGRLRVKKIGSKSIVLAEDRRTWRKSLPDYRPANAK